MMKTTCYQKFLNDAIAKKIARFSREYNSRCSGENQLSLTSLLLPNTRHKKTTNFHFLKLQKRKTLLNHFTTSHAQKQKLLFVQQLMKQLKTYFYYSPTNVQKTFGSNGLFWSVASWLMINCNTTNRHLYTFIYPWSIYPLIFLIFVKVPY